MKVAFDTNILAYAEGINGVARQREANTLIQSIPRQIVILPVQTLGELFSVLVRKGGRTIDVARIDVLRWADGYALTDTSRPVVVAALDLVSSHKLSIWDSMILAASAAASCRLLLSEDMQDGFTWSGVTVVNPFANVPNALLAAAQISPSPPP